LAFSFSFHYFLRNFWDKVWEKRKNSFKRTVSHPASVAVATEGVAGANAVAFQKQKKAKPEEIPSVRDVVLFTDLH